MDAEGEKERTGYICLPGGLFYRAFSASAAMKSTRFLGTFAANALVSMYHVGRPGGPAQYSGLPAPSQLLDNEQKPVVKVISG